MILSYTFRDDFPFRLGTNKNMHAELNLRITV